METTSDLIQILLKQTPTIALLGYICWTVWKAYLAEKDKKDAQRILAHNNRCRLLTFQVFTGDTR